MYLYTIIVTKTSVLCTVKWPLGHRVNRLYGSRDPSFQQTQECGANWELIHHHQATSYINHYQSTISYINPLFWGHYQPISIHFFSLTPCPSGKAAKTWDHFSIVWCGLWSLLGAWRLVQAWKLEETGRRFFVPSGHLMLWKFTILRRSNMELHGPFSILPYCQTTRGLIVAPPR